jgi:glycosyltransferase involved in cell wall biosynthesis
MIAPSFYPSVGGVETHVRRVATCLTQHGHQVSVLTHAEAASQERLGSLVVHRLPKTGWRAAWRLARPHIARAEVVHCHDAYSFLHFYLPSRWLPPRRPVFATFHGYEGYPIPKEAIRRRRFVSRRLRDAICMGDFICQWYASPCFAVSYGGVDPVPDPPAPAAEPSALFIGRLAEDTAIMAYLEAVLKLRRQHGHDLPIGVVGDGPLRAAAERYAQANWIKATFHGTVADPIPLLSACRLAFVSGYLSIWQALSLRRQVFALHQNPLKRDYLLGFPSASEVMVVAAEAEELAGSLARYLADPSRGAEMIARGARLASENTWDRVANLYLAMYQKHGIA